MKRLPDSTLPLSDASGSSRMGIVDYNDAYFPNDSVLSNSDVEYLYVRGGVSQDSEKGSLLQLRIDSTRLSRFVNLKYIEFVGFDMDSSARYLLYRSNLIGLSMVNCGIENSFLQGSFVSHLVYLDLAFNAVSSLELFVPERFPELQYLNLSRNSMRSISGLSRLSQLRSIDLSNRYNLHDNWVLWGDDVTPFRDRFNQYDESLSSSELFTFVHLKSSSLLMLEVSNRCETLQWSSNRSRTFRKDLRRMLKEARFYVFNVDPMGVEILNPHYIRLRQGILRSILYSGLDNDCKE
jgi:Leucine-rich repeat (LRR) protein